VRRRLLGAIVGLVAAALLLFAVPLALAVRGVLVDRALDGLEGQVQQIATFVEVRARTCGEVQLWLTAAAEQELDVAAFDPDGTLRFAAGRVRPAPAGPEVTTALEGRAGRTRADGRLAVAVPLSTRVCGNPLVLRGSTADAALAASVRGSLLAIAATGVGVLVVAVGAALWTGRRLSGPFEELAGSARALGHGDFTARAPRSGLPEADQIAAALDTTADRLGRAAQRGAAFTADASHQLRTPLTALQLQLDALAAGGADPETVAAAQAEADRLDGTIDELVALTRIEAAPHEVDLADLVEERVDAWRRRAEALGRELTVQRTPTPPLRIRTAAVGQALQVLLDNALAHGRGRIEVRVTPTSPSAAVRGVQVCVLDEGPGFDPAAALPPAGRDRGAAPVRGGRGLALARSLVEAEGGRLLLDSSADGTRACLVLPGA
jgi:signal transduction histidine kinase